MIAFRPQTKSRILSAGTLKDRIAAMRTIPSLTNAWKPIARSFPWKDDTIPRFSGTALYPHLFDSKVSLSAPYALSSMPSSASPNTPDRVCRLPMPRAPSQVHRPGRLSLIRSIHHGPAFGIGRSRKAVWMAKGRRLPL